MTCETLLILHSTTSELSNPISYRSPSFSLFLEHIRHPTSGLLHLPFPLPGLLLLPISTWLTPSHSVGLDLTVTFLLRPSLSPLLQIAKQPQTHFTHKYKHTGVYDSYAPSLVYFSPGQSFGKPITSPATEALSVQVLIGVMSLFRIRSRSFSLPADSKLRSERRAGHQGPQPCAHPAASGFSSGGWGRGWERTVTLRE